MSDHTSDLKPVRGCASAALACLVAGLVPLSVVAADSDVVITVTYPGNNAEYQVFEAQAKKVDFKLKKVDLRLVHIDPGNYWTKVSAMFAAGVGPDVLFMSEPFPEYAKKGYIADLGPMIAGDKEYNIKDFFQVGLKFFQWKGKQMGIPKDLNPWSIFWHADMFARAGLSSPNEVVRSGRWDWTTFANTAKRLTQDTNGDGKPDQYGAGFMSPMVWPFAGWVYASGGSYLDEDRSTCLLDKPDGVDALQFAADIRLKYAAYSSQDFTSGKIGMFDMGSYNISSLKTAKAKFVWDVAPMPMKEGKPKAFYSHIGGWAINSSTKHLEEAWEALRALTSVESETQVAILGHGGVPPRKSVAGKEAYLKGGGMPPSAEVFLDEIEFGRIFPFVSQQAQVDAALNRNVAKVLSGKMSALAACQEMARQINLILAK